MSITGSCLCGAVRYEAPRDPAWAHHCHCSHCRQSKGAAYATNLFVPLNGVRFTDGEDQLQSFKVPEAERFAWHLGALAFVEIDILWTLILATIVTFWRVRPLAGALLLPYLAWVTFASALAWSMWKLNPVLLG